MTDEKQIEDDDTNAIRRTDSGHVGNELPPIELTDIGEISLHRSPQKSSDNSAGVAGLTCAVVTPIGPGHEELYQECLATIEQAIQRGTGPFDRIEIITIDDTTGELGRSRARNDGVWESLKRKADWIFFLDADDLLHDTAFEEFGLYAEKYDAVWGAIVEIEHGSTAPKLRMPQLLSIETVEELLLFDPFLTLQMGHFVKSEIAAQFPFNESMEAGEDFDYYLRLWNRCRCVKAPVEFFVNRRGKHSTGPRSADGKDWMDAVKAVLNRERSQQKCAVEMARTVGIRNHCVEAVQRYTRSLPQKLDYLTMSRQMPWRGYFDVSHFEHDGFVMFSDNDDLIALSLAWSGEYEPASARMWQDLASGCEMILDIGAYTGLYAFLAARAAPEAMVMGFEPLSKNHSRFVLNRNLNKLANVYPVRAAVSNVSGNVELANFSGGDFLTSGASIIQDHKGKPNDVEAVPAVTIDEFLRQNSLAMPGLVKIDVEGAELNVLQGMKETLDSARPDILIECLQGTDTESLTALLEPLGYHFFRICESPRTIEQTATLTAGSGLLDLNRIATTRTPDEMANLCNQKSQRQRSMVG